MLSSRHTSHPSTASSLPWVADACGAIRRGKLEISKPIPILQDKAGEPTSRMDDALHGYQISPTSSGKTDTGPRRSTAPALHLFNPPYTDNVPGFHASASYFDSNRTSAALTNTPQSMSSLPSDGSMKRGGGIRATLRRMFGSKRSRDSFSTGVHDQRSVRNTALFSRATLRPIYNWTKLTYSLFRTRSLFSTILLLPIIARYGSLRSCSRNSFEAERRSIRMPPM
jgi:hypothetical protein